MAEHLSGRKETFAARTHVLAFLAVQRDLVLRTIVLAREGLGAPQRAGERRARLGLMRVHRSYVWSRHGYIARRVVEGKVCVGRNFKVEQVADAEVEVEKTRGESVLHVGS
ncbi:hypothetical protein C8R44DRAFT_940726 [Mycena epipterygia]|nr:hypothetical protein C8R44DRAFT_940726 [Mycena epipterygia]